MKTDEDGWTDEKWERQPDKWKQTKRDRQSNTHVEICRQMKTNEKGQTV